MNNSFFNVLLTRSATALSFGLPHSVMLGMIPYSLSNLMYLTFLISVDTFLLYKLKR